MSGNIDAIKKEMIQLEADYLAHVNKHGFSYREYSNPPPGSFMEKYKKRMAELTVASGVKPLEYYKG
ncbi:MAG: hypothetical protein CVV05_13840 [Gammaproteobacteria bacterium HGW-Gammaproteobacteria-1]|jgi:hypothetical protein|nr:MAG: hypothetical protein CVV05_13840 [Gammaproteobacteria bacterium HGW-Gammaproteobacteria-1]